MVLRILHIIRILDFDIHPEVTGRALWNHTAGNRRCDGGDDFVGIRALARAAGLANGTVAAILGPVFEIVAGRQRAFVEVLGGGGALDDGEEREENREDEEKNRCGLHLGLMVVIVLSGGLMWPRGLLEGL